MTTRLPRRLRWRTTPEPLASRPTGPAAYRAGRSGRSGFADRFLQDLAAAATVAAGHQLGRPGRASPLDGGLARRFTQDLAAAVAAGGVRFWEPILRRPARGPERPNRT